ncbi:MAG: hypothetical protein AB8U72_01050 [Anaplasma ovis]
MQGGSGDIRSELLDAIRTNNAKGVRKVLKALPAEEKAVAMCRPIFDDKPLLQYALAEGKTTPSPDAFKAILEFCTPDILNTADPSGNQPVFMVLEAPIEYLRAMLDTKGVNWGISNARGDTPLAHALKTRPDQEFDMQSLTKLARLHPHALYRVNKSGNNILHSACESGEWNNIAFAMNLHDTVSDTPLGRNAGGSAADLLNHKNGLGETPLHIAYRKLSAEDSKLFDLYFQDGIKADLLAKDREGKSVIYRAVEANNEHIYDLCDGNVSYTRELAMCALESDNQSIINRLIGPQPTTDGPPALLKECVRELLKDPERLVRCLNSGDSKTDLWEALYNTLDTPEDKATFMCCAAASAHYQLNWRLNNLVSQPENLRALNDETSLALEDSHSLENPDLLGSVVSRFPDSSCVSVDKIAELALKNPTADALLSMLQRATENNTTGVILKAISQRNCSGVSAVSKMIGSSDGEKIFEFLDGVSRRSALLNQVLANDGPLVAGMQSLREEVLKATLSLASTGDIDKMRAIFRAIPDAVYAEDPISGKSVLEIASDAGQLQTTHFLIEFHKKIARNAEISTDAEDLQRAIESIVQVARVAPDTASNMVDGILQSGKNIPSPDANRILQNAAPENAHRLAAVLERKYPGLTEQVSQQRAAPPQRRKGLAELYVPRQSDLGPARAADSPSARVDNDNEELQNYGLLRKYVAILQTSADDPHKFKTTLKEDFETFESIKQAAHADNTGHSIFTLVAMRGTPTQMDLLVSKFGEIRNSNLAFRANYESFSSLGSPLQCAIRGGNLTMAHHLLGKMDHGKICVQYGTSKDNLLHTLIKTGRLDILFSLPHATQPPNSNTSSFVTQAILQMNADGKTPMDVALSMGEEPRSALCAFITGAVQDKDMERLLGSGAMTQLALNHNSPSMMRWVFDLAAKFNTRQEANRARTRIDVLGNMDNTKTLMARASRSSNPEVHQVLLEKIREKYPNEFPEVSKQLLMHLAENNLYNPALFSDLEESVRSSQDAVTRDYLIKQAIKHDNPDLIRHIRTADACGRLSEMQELHSANATSPYAVLKDNMLAFFMANLDQESFNRFANENLSHIVEQNMPKACEVFIQRSPDNTPLLEAAIHSGNIQIVEAVLNRNPNTLLRTYDAQDYTVHNSLYDFATSVCPKNEAGRAMLRYLAHRTVNAVLEKDRVASTTTRPDEASTQHGPESEPFSQSSEFANTLKSILLRHNLGLNTENRRTIDRYASTANADAFQQAGSENLLRIALESRDCQAAEKLLEDYINRNGREPNANTTAIINQSIDGRSILHLAASNGNYKILANLIALGGNPALTTDSGENVAHLCAQSGMKKEDGTYAFASLIRDASANNVSLNTADGNGKGVLEHAANCNDKASTVEMLGLIRNNPELDSRLSSRKEGKKRDDFFRDTIAGACLQRQDDAIDTFLDNNPQLKTDAKRDLSLELLAKSKNPDDDTLANLLTSTSLHSFNEIYPLERASPIVGQPRNTFIGHQMDLLSIVNSRTVKPHDLERMSRMPMEAFSARDYRTGVSPIEHAIAVKNLDFIKYVLEHRISELRPNICDAAGDNLPVQLSRFIAENPETLQQDQHFAKLYTNLLERCHCTAQSPSRTSVRGILENNARLISLRDKAADSARRESLLKDQLSLIEHRLRENYEPQAVSQLTAFVKDNPEFSRNSANTFRTLFLHAISDAVSSHQGLSDHHKRYIKELIKNGDTRKLLTNVDHEGNNAIQSVLNELSKSKIGIGIAKADALQEVFSELLENLSNEDPELLKEVLLKHRNARGENCLETLASVKPAYGVFRAIETKLGAKTIAEFCDLNTILVRASNQAALQRHIYENYAVFPVGGCDAEQNVRVHIAATSGDHSAFIAAMQTGSNINQLDKDGNTPLQSLLIYLVQNRGNITDGHIKILETLVSHGAALHHKNNNGLSACDMAKELKGSLFGQESSCLQFLARHRLQYDKLKQEAQDETDKRFVKSKEQGQSTHCDISGATIAIKLDGGTLLTSKLLYSDLCSRNNLSRATFDFNQGQDKGYVEKVGNKRNYVATEGVVKLTLSWKPAQGPEQKVVVMVHADGKISVAPDSISKCGSKGEKLNFNNCRVYVGGFSLEDALRNGVWKTRLAQVATDRERSPDVTQETGQSPDMGEQRSGERGPERDGDAATLAMQDARSEPSIDAQERSDTEHRRQRSASYPDLRLGESNSELPQLQNYITGVSDSEPHPAPRSSIANRGNDPSGGASLQAETGQPHTEGLQSPGGEVQSPGGHGHDGDMPSHTTRNADTGQKEPGDATHGRQRRASYPDLRPEAADSQPPRPAPRSSIANRGNDPSGGASLQAGTDLPHTETTQMYDGVERGDGMESSPITPHPVTQAHGGEVANDAGGSPSDSELHSATDGRYPSAAEAHGSTPDIASMGGDSTSNSEQRSGQSSEVIPQPTASALQYHESVNNTAATTEQSASTVSVPENMQLAQQGVQEWARITGVCNDIDNYYAFNTNENSDVASASAAIKALRDKHMTNGHTDDAVQALRKEIPEELKKYDIDSKDLGTDPTVIMLNGVVQHPGISIPDNWTSPYGFGNNLDAEIKSELQFITSVCDRSSMDCTIKMPLRHLPMLAIAAQKISNNPPIGVDLNAPNISQADGERILKDIANTCMLCEEITVGSRQASVAYAMPSARQSDDTLHAMRGNDSSNQEASRAASPVSYSSDDEGVASEGDDDYHALDAPEDPSSLSWDHSYDTGPHTGEQAGSESEVLDSMELDGIESAQLPPSSQLSQETADILRDLGVQDSSNKLAPDQSHEGQDAAQGEDVASPMTAWQSIMHVCKQSGFYYAFDIPYTCNIEDIASKLLSKYETIAELSDLGVSERRLEVAKAIHDVIGEHGAKCAVLGTPIQITNDNMAIVDSGQIIPEEYSSPYGFGAEVDSQIKSALSSVREIARRSSNDFTMKIPLEHLPRIVEAVEREKARPPSGIAWPQLGVGESSAIDKADGERLLKDITNICLHATAELSSPQEIFSGSVREIAEQWEQMEERQRSGSMSSAFSTRSRSSTASSMSSEPAQVLSRLSASSQQQLESAIEGLTQGLYNTQPNPNNGEAERPEQETAQQHSEEDTSSSVGAQILRAENWAGLSQSSSPESAITLEECAEHDGAHLPEAPTPTPDVKQKEGGMERQ